MTRKIFLTICICCGMASMATAQKKLLKEGNQLYEAGNYKEAADAYQKALMNNPGDIKGLFNLGNAMYRQKKYEEARKLLSTAAKTDKPGQAAASYNVGNTYMQEQKWDEAIEAYKQALRNNPRDEDAKYNLSYAQAMKQKQQGDGGGQDKQDKNDKNEQKDENKNDQGNQDEQQEDKQDQQGENKDEKDQQEQDGQNEQDKNGEEEQEEQKRPKPQPSKISEQQAEQLLKALQQDEKKLMDKMRQEKGVPVRVEKDW